MTTTVEPRPYDRADRIDALLVLGVMVVDVLLLAIIEMMFATLRIGDQHIPVSIVLALVTTPWLVSRTGDLATGTIGAVLVFLLWAVTVLVLGFSGPGGDVLLLNDWPSRLVLLAGTATGALALGRVIRARRDARREAAG